jgi:hypothetical protein
VKEALAGDLGLQKFTRRRASHTLSDPQKIQRVEVSNELTQIVNDLKVEFFDGITTDEEPWFQYRYESSVLFTKSPGDLVPKTTKRIGMKKTMIPMICTNKKMLVANDLPRCQKYNQDYFIPDILPELEQQKGYKRKKRDGTFYEHMDHSECHDGGKIQENSRRKVSYALAIHLILLI